MDEFMAKIEEAIEQEANPKTKFRTELPWNSLLAISVITMLEDDYNVEIDIDEFLNIETFEELYRLCIQ